MAAQILEALLTESGTASTPLRLTGSQKAKSARHAARAPQAYRSSAALARTRGVILRWPRHGFVGACLLPAAVAVQLAETDKMLTDGADEYLQLSSLLSNVMRNVQDVPVR